MISNLAGFCNEVFCNVHTTITPVQYTIQIVLDPVFYAESDGDLRFDMRARPSAVWRIANLQSAGGSKYQEIEKKMAC